MGFDITTKPLLSDEYILELYSRGSRNKWKVLKAYLRRSWTLLNSSRYDVVWLEKELFPYIPFCFEWIFQQFMPAYIVDYDDATFTGYQKHRNPIVRFLLGSKIFRVMRYAVTCIGGNKYLTDIAKKAGCPHVSFIPTVIRMSEYDIVDHNKNEKLTIGWIGSPSTIRYLEEISQVFQVLATKYDFQLTVIGAKIEIKGVDCHCIPWDCDTEVKELKRCHIGVMPLSNSEWELGKCGYKLVQYKACGLPVVAQNVGANRDIVIQTKTGFLVGSLEQWTDALERLILDGKLRESFGDEAYLQAEAKYTVEVSIRKIVAAFSVVKPLSDSVHKNQDKSEGNLY